MPTSGKKAKAAVAIDRELFSRLIESVPKNATLEDYHGLHHRLEEMVNESSSMTVSLSISSQVLHTKLSIKSRTASTFNGISAAAQLMGVKFNPNNPEHVFELEDGTPDVAGEEYSNGSERTLKNHTDIYWCNMPLLECAAPSSGILTVRRPFADP